MVAEKILFHSPYPNYEVVYKSARVTHTQDGMPIVDEGKRVRFVRGVLEVDAGDTEALAGIRRSKFYGVDFFEHGANTHQSLSVEDPEKAEMRRRIAELEAKLGRDEFEGLTGLPRLNALKKRAAELGITPQDGWKAKDYEDAIRQNGGAQ